MLLSTCVAKKSDIDITSPIHNIYKLILVEGDYVQFSVDYGKIFKLA